VALAVENNGQASTSNATIQHIDSNGEIVWTSGTFTVNASNSTTIDLDISDISIDDEGSWQLYYQKRVINSSKWVTEPINSSVVMAKSSDNGEGLFGYGIFNPVTVIVSVIGLAALLRPEDEEICESESHDN
jgi:hypothetical protein